MPNSLFPKYRQAALEGSIAYLTDNIKAVLVDLNTYGLAISSSTNATPPVITTATHGYTSGDQVIIGQHLTNTAANNIATGTKFYITVLSTTTFSLYTDVARTAGVVGNGVSINVLVKDINLALVDPATTTVTVKPAGGAPLVVTPTRLSTGTLQYNWDTTANVAPGTYGVRAATTNPNAAAEAQIYLEPTLLT